MGKVIRKKNIEPNRQMEPNLVIDSGIDSTTVPNVTMNMVKTTIPPGARNRRHYHVTTNAANYILKGRLRYSFGPDYQKEEFIVEAGEFVFIPQGEIHGLLNLSDTEAAEMVALYDKVGSREASQPIFVEPPVK